MTEGPKDGATTATLPRVEIFEVEYDHLMHRVAPRRGKPYVHRCPRSSCEQIAHAAEELGAEGFTLESLVDYERQAGRYIAYTNVAVVLAFLRERSILDIRYRRNYVATSCAHLGAMSEFYALAENG